MRCLACNIVLTDRESTRKSVLTGEYLDLCNSCLKDLDIVYTENNELPNELFLEEEEHEYISEA